MRYQNENFNGEYEFRCRRHTHWQVKTHLHEYSELLYCAAGRVQAVVGGRRILLQEKELLWLPPNQVHQYELTQGEAVCAVFSGDLIPLFFKACAGRRYAARAVAAEELVPILERLWEQDPKELCKVSGILNLVLAKVLKEAEFVSAEQGDGALTAKVIPYLSEHLTENLTLASVAKHFGYNEKYLSHTLHSLTGIHFRRLLSFYRVRRAKELLEKERELSVTTVAMKSGFSAVNTFHRAFRAETGMTPLAYRKAMAK